MITVQWVGYDGYMAQAKFESQEHAMQDAIEWSKSDPSPYYVYVDGELVAIAKDGELYGKIE